MFKSKERAYKDGYEHGFSDALEMVKQIVRQKSSEHSEEKELQWEVIENGEIHPEA